MCLFVFACIADISLSYSLIANRSFVSVTHTLVGGRLEIDQHMTTCMYTVYWECWCFTGLDAINACPANNSICTNTDPSYQCSCAPYYTGDGYFTCEDIDECSVNGTEALCGTVANGNTVSCLTYYCIYIYYSYFTFFLMAYIWKDASSTMVHN